jgi:predicted ribosomally synthesized peptide with SipW-like signal peptide
MKKIMKRKYAVALVAVVVAAGSLAAFADKQASAGKVLLLKSGGKTIAELRVRATVNLAVQCANSSGHAEYDKSTGALVASGGAILTLSTGTNSISVRADEIESVTDPN